MNQSRECINDRIQFWRLRRMEWSLAQTLKKYEWRTSPVHCAMNFMVSFYKVQTENSVYSRILWKITDRSRYAGGNTISMKFGMKIHIDTGRKLCWDHQWLEIVLWGWTISLFGWRWKDSWSESRIGKICYWTKFIEAKFFALKSLKRELLQSVGGCECSVVEKNWNRN